MSTYPFSGSSAERAIACPASTVLPAVDQIAGEAARDGTVGHLFLELCAKHDRDYALAHIGKRYPDALELCEAIAVDELPTELAHEVAFAFDCETGEARELGRGLERGYEKFNLKPFEIPLTIDVLGMSPESVFIADYKFGRTAITEARRNMQVGLAALCAARVYKRHAATVEIIKPGRDGSRPYRDRAELDIFALDAIAAQFRAWPARYKIAADALERGERVPVVEGAHCQWCRSFTTCPAKTALAIRLATGEEVSELNQALTPATAAQCYQRLQAGEQMLKKIRGVLYAYASQEPIEIAPGRWLGMHTKRGNEKLDGAAAHAVIKLLHGDEVADECVEFAATKAGIDRALKTAGVKPRAGAHREILSRLKAHGGITRDESTKVREYSE